MAQIKDADVVEPRSTSTEVATIDADDDEFVDQVSLVLNGEQERDNLVHPFAFPGEGEHQMKGLFAEVNPVHVGEAEALAAREALRDADAEIEEEDDLDEDEEEDQVLRVQRRAERRNPPREPGAEVTRLLVPEPSPKETVVRSGTNDYTEIDRVDDRRVAGDRLVDNYAEKMGVTIDPLRDPNANPLLPDPQKVNPRTGVQWTTDDPEPLAAVLDSEGTSYIRVDELNDIEVEEPDEDDTAPAEGLDAIEEGEVPEGVTGEAYPDDSYEDVEVPEEGFGEEVEVDEETGEVIDEEDEDDSFDPDSATVEDLRSEASARNIEGRSSMSKDDLIKAVKKDIRKNG